MLYLVESKKLRKNEDTYLEEVSRFNPYSNIRYMEESRNNNALLDNLMDFIVFSIPLTLGLWFLYYRIFYCLFEY